MHATSVIIKEASSCSTLSTFQLVTPAQYILQSSTIIPEAFAAHAALIKDMRADAAKKLTHEGLPHITMHGKAMYSYHPLLNQELPSWRGP